MLNELIKDSILTHRNQPWNRKLNSLDKGSKPFSNLAKIIKKKNTYIPALKEGNNLLISNAQKATAFAETFYENHLATSSIACNTFIESVVLDSINFLNSSPLDEIQNFSFTEVKGILLGLRTRKSVGFDGIKNIYLKKLPKIGIQFLQLLFNCCLKLNYFPNIPCS